jgi:hypothetical protein
MKMIDNLMKTSCLVLAVAAWTSVANADIIPVSGWIVHNGTSMIGGTASNPTFTAGDNITLMAPFADVTLANDGDFVEGKTTLTLNARTANTGINALNTQLRFALLDTTNATLTANDFPNLGLTMEYSNLAAGGLMREQSSAVQTNPFTSPTNVGNGSQDAGGDSIQGANPGPITFDYKLTRNGGKLDLSGTISGTDSVSGNPYSAPFSFTGFSSATFPANGTFTFNRMAVFLGPNADGTSASLTDSQVITIPEPASLALAVGLVFGGLLTRRQHARRAPGHAGRV